MHRYQTDCPALALETLPKSEEWGSAKTSLQVLYLLGKRLHGIEALF
jgi:hypothetical protein